MGKRRKPNHRAIVPLRILRLAGSRRVFIRRSEDANEIAEFFRERGKYLVYFQGYREIDAATAVVEVSGCGEEKEGDVFLELDELPVEVSRICSGLDRFWAAFILAACKVREDTPADHREWSAGDMFVECVQNYGT